MNRLFLMDRKCLEAKIHTIGVDLDRLLRFYALRENDTYCVIDYLSDIGRLSDGNMKVIPVGNLAFMKDALEYIGATGKVLEAIKVPDCLMEFTGRYCERLTGKELLDTSKEFKETHTAVDIYDISRRHGNAYYLASDIEDDINAKSVYFVSDVTNFESEYRVFVLDGEVKAVQHYAGDVLKFPNSEEIKKYISKMSESMSELRAYSIDIGIKDNQTYVVGVSNFISSYLYGFCEKCILDMLEAGVDYELSMSEKHK